MEIREFNPDNIKISELNERKENLNIGELEESVKKQGIIQPPIVRINNGTPEVVVGQRRVMAASAAGLDKIPCVVMEWDDAEALLSSIIENIDAFREKVSRRDRAAALLQLMDKTGMNQKKIADELGVSPKTVNNWLERGRPEWEGTVFHPDTGEKDKEEKTSITKESTSTTSKPTLESVQKAEEIDEQSLEEIRSITGGGKEGEELALKIADKDLSQKEVKEIAKSVRRGKEIEEAIETVEKEKPEKGEIRVRARVTVTGQKAEALRDCAKDRATSEEEIVREAIERYLEEEGYL